MSSKRSRVHPKYKTKYRVRNWSDYNRALVQRGDLTIWFTDDAVAAWTPKKAGRRGAQQKYSDLAIETALTLRLVYGLPWRQTEGFLNSVLRLMQLKLTAPDYTTLSRRSAKLESKLKRRPSGPIHLIVDSTGLSVRGEGQWATWNYRLGGSRRGWRKLHLGVDGDGFIVASSLTSGSAADATTAVELIDQLDCGIERFTADGAYDAACVYEAVAGHAGESLEVVIPPRRGARTHDVPHATAPWRTRHIERIGEIGRRAWRLESGQHQQAKAENAVFRFKRIIGPRLRASGERARRADRDFKALGYVGLCRCCTRHNADCATLPYM
jgi:hypothetical protein